jgi:hypothetical protein
MRVIGPGAIALSMAMGSGEWLIGPAVTVQYGLVLLWITTVAVFLQVVFNTEACRYTFYTGEPVMTGFMRTWPGPRLWGWVYWLFSMLSNLWPGWAAAAATALAAIMLGRIPGAADKGTVVMFGYATFLLCVVVTIFGGRIERALEYVSWSLVIFIFTFLILVNIFWVPGSVWGSALGGLVSFGQLPSGADMILMGSFVAYSGAGGNGNALITNWMRDKGWGMGSLTGYIPSAVGGTVVHLSHSGKVFPVTPENKRRWDEWMRYLTVDQWILWAGGCVVGMMLCTMLAVNFVPAGTKIDGWGVAAYQANGLAQKGGQLLWVITLLNGFFVLWGTQLTAVDHVTRISTDLAWQGSAWLRSRGRSSDVRVIYYGVLVVFVIWGMVAMNLVQPLMLIMINANIAGLTFVFLALHVLYINRKFLPKEIRTPLWKQILLVAFALWSAVFVWFAYSAAWVRFTGG